jgi:hypothetical protein
MPQYRFDIVQNSEEWEQIRYGKFTASIAADLLMDKKNKGYTNLIDKIVEERITGEQNESSKFGGNGYTERGHELEIIAREDYEFRSFNDVQIVGVVEYDDWCLCSPDGLIDSDGIHQIKCPIFKTHREYLKIIHANKGLEPKELFKKIDSGYYKQLQFELFVTDRKYNVFTSFHPKLPAIDIVVYRDEEMIEEIKQRLSEAKEEVLKEIEFIYSLK